MRCLFIAIILLSINSIGLCQTLDSTKTGTYFFKTNQKTTIKGYFKNAKRHKIWTWYNGDGSIQKQVKYKQGSQIWLVYFDNNKPWLRIDRYGKRHIIRVCECNERS